MPDSESAATFELHAMAVRGMRISWEVPHARERANERDVTIFEAERVVRSGSVVRVDADTSGTRWRIEGFDVDLRPIHVVVKVVGAAILRVITVIRTDQ